jgi:hypothetical protein
MLFSPSPNVIYWRFNDFLSNNISHDASGQYSFDTETKLQCHLTWHSSHQPLNTERDIFSRILDTNSILTWKITWEDFILNYFLFRSNRLKYGCTVCRNGIEHAEPLQSYIFWAKPDKFFHYFRFQCFSSYSLVLAWERCLAHIQLILFYHTWI